MKKKNPYRVYSLWNRLKKVLGGMSAQDFVLLQPSTRGSDERVYYIRGSFVFEGIKKTVRVMIQPNYVGEFGISAQYRDELTFVAQNSRISAREIRVEMNRLIDIWDLGKKSENTFANMIKQSYMCPDVAKSSGDDDRNNRIDYYISLYQEDGRTEGPRVPVDVKSSRPKHMPEKTLVYRRSDGVYEIDASDTAIAGVLGWADAVILEILWLEQKNNKAR